MRDEKAYFGDIPTPRIARDMIKLAEHILDTKAAHFDPKRFNDRYETALRKLVKRKASGKKIEEPAPDEKPSNVVSLMEALRRSAGEGKRRPRPRVIAPAQEGRVKADSGTERLASGAVITGATRVPPCMSWKT
jgi:DNA end-binding protein Ku